MINLNMRHFLKIAAVCLLACSTVSCYDDYIADYDYPNMGFALPKQVRTVMSKTNRIYVGVSIGGKREVNMKDWAQFTLDESLLTGLPYKMLPENYYTLADPTMFTVRKSNMPVADVAITFTDAFYEDPASLSNTYALPFRLVATSIPDAEGSKYGAIRRGAETAIVVIKYVSSYSGTYYRMGEISEIDHDGNVIGETEIHKNPDLIKNPTVKFSTAGYSTITFSGIGCGKTDGTVTLSIDKSKGLDDNAAVTVSLSSGLESGSGEWIRKGDYTFYSGDSAAPQFNLEYIYTDGGRRYQVKETFVLRKWAEDELTVETF